jgi:nucleotide-binding universal stress UspA family protein
MAFKKILVPVTGADTDAVALTTAFAAARPFNGHVQALFVYPDPREAVPFVGMPVSPEVVQQIIDNSTTIAETAQGAARAHVEAAAKDAGVAMIAAPAAKPQVTCSFREVHGGFISAIAEAAKLSDLIVFGPSTLEGGPDVSGAFIETLTGSERPVLLAPEKPVTDLTARIAIGWDGGAAAAHALSAALPLLAAAGKVELYSVQPVPDGSASLDAAGEYLALHGVAATARTIDPAGANPGAVLLKEAGAAHASLLVLGGYGHSRIFETLFGGTTIHVTAHSTLPLLMVH